MLPSNYKPALSVLVQELVALRQRAGISMRELGRRIGQPQSIIHRIEHGQRRVDHIELAIICTACGESIITFSKRLTARFEELGLGESKEKLDNCSQNAINPLMT